MGRIIKGRMRGTAIKISFKESSSFATNGDDGLLREDGRDWHDGGR